MKLHFAPIIFFCILIQIPIIGFSQKDSAKKNVVSKTVSGTEEGFTDHPNKLEILDTSLEVVYHFDPAYNLENHFTNLGNNFTTTHALYLNPIKPVGFDFGFNQWNFYNYNRNNIKWYDTHTPYADFMYAQGNREMQYFNGIFSYNFKPNMNVSVQYRKMTSTGFYGNQASDLQNLAANFWYRSPSRKYMAMAGSIWNWMKQGESGGYNDSTVEKYITNGVSTDFLAQMIYAKQQYSDRNYFVKQYYYLGKTESKKLHDTDKVATKLFYPKLYLAHDISFYEKKFYYKDSLSDFKFFDNSNDTFQTKDNFRFRDLSNEVSIGTATNQSLKDSSGTNVFNFKGYLKHNFLTATLPNTADATFQNLSVGGNVSLITFIDVKAKAEYIFTGYNQGDFLFTARASKSLMKNELFTSITQQKYSPAYTETIMRSNHFYWDNSWNKTNVSNISLGAKSDSLKYKVMANYSLVNNYIYYLSNGRPAQNNNLIQNASIQLNKSFEFHHFFWRNDAILQKTLQGSDVIKLPFFSYHTSFSYGNNFFKNALFAQLGVDMRYFSSYQAYAYMPELSAFVLQNATTIGNYPFFDIWAAARIKRFQFFFIVSHINQGLNGNRYYTIAHYPQSPSTTPIRLGLRWRFYN
ncbi:MAG: hypothetical protein NTX03_12670 [Bacteroidetes bacterium]|nr:hypothetical protein [Bacteroidota bacterium]